MRLLIDGDWLCFSTAIAFQSENPFSGDIEFDGTTARMVIEQRVRKAVELMKAKEVTFYFSCNRKDNWRRSLVESYKMNREGKLSPIGLTALRTHCTASYESVEVDTLEADDLIGIDATGKYKGDNCIVSVDKDFLTIPTTIYNPVKKIVKHQSKVDAFKFFFYQVMIGDSADGYKGLFRVGPKKAKAFLAKHSKNLYNIWEPLVELAEKCKQDEEYLLSQCRMAHILQEGDYDFETKEVRLWEPSDIERMLE